MPQMQEMSLINLQCIQRGKEILQPIVAAKVKSILAKSRF
jgi:hypothetical protein